MSLTTSCTVTAYNHNGKFEGKRLSLVSCTNGYVEVQIDGCLSDAIWVDGDELKRAVENMINTNKLD